MSGNYGTFVTEADVVAAARTTAQTWINTYVDDVARQRSVTLPPIRKYGTSLATDTDSELPAMAFSCPGLYGDPERHGDGTYEAPFALGAGVVVADVDKDRALALAALYGAAVTEMFVQKGSLGGFAIDTAWIDRETVLQAYELDRCVAASTSMFVVRVGAVVHRFTGPATPPVDPTLAPPNTPTVTTRGITVARLT